MPADLGSWSISGGIDLLLRDRFIADAGAPFGDQGNLVPLVSGRLGVVY